MGWLSPLLGVIPWPSLPGGIVPEDIVWAAAAAVTIFTAWKTVLQPVITCLRRFESKLDAVQRDVRQLRRQLASAQRWQSDHEADAQYIIGKLEKEGDKRDKRIDALFAILLDDRR